MKIKAIKYDKEEQPEKVTVTMSMNEAYDIVKRYGNLTPTTEVTTEIYECLTSFFNKHYEGGYNEYANEGGE